MKIKISYTDSEIIQANEIEVMLRRFFKSEKSLKIRKPKKIEPFQHTYIAVGKSDKKVI